MLLPHAAAVFASGVLLLGICDGGASDAPLAPEGFEGSCAAKLYSWDDINQHPDEVTSFLCIDEPSARGDIKQGGHIRGWASYPFTPDIVIQLQVVDALGRAALQSYTHHFDARSGAVWLVPFDEVIPIPRDIPAGDDLRIVVILGNAQTGDGLASAEVTAAYRP